MKHSMKDASDEPLTMTIQEVAAALQCSDRHVTNLRKRGEIPQPAKIGRRKVRWSRRHILEWIDSGCPAIAV